MPITRFFGSPETFHAAQHITSNGFVTRMKIAFGEYFTSFFGGGAAQLLANGAPLILYGPWNVDGAETAPSNRSFDADLKSRDPRWGLRTLSDFRAEAERRGLMFVEMRFMPANNVMLLFRRGDPVAA